MHVYQRYLRAELRARSEANFAKANMLARWKARAYKMYAVDCLYD